MNAHHTDPAAPAPEQVAKEAAEQAAAIEEAARQCLAANYGIAGELTRLPGENLNFLVTTAGNRKYVFKIVDEHMPATVVELEFAAIAHARKAGFGPRMPGIVQNRYRKIETGINLPIKGEFRSRIIEFINGTDLSLITDISEKLLRNVGRTVAAFAHSMEGFEHPAARRNHRWNLADSLQHRDEVASIPEPEKRALLEWAFDTFRAARPAFDELPWQFIHGDAHDENLLVEDDRVVGLIDFGDACRNPTVADLAICLTYLMMRGDDPLAVARTILGGYESVRPLSATERDVLYPMICGRLAVSLCIANARKRIDPHNPNWFGGEGRTWRWLQELAELSCNGFQAGLSRQL